MDNTTSGETGATFNSPITDATIPDSPGVGAEPQQQTNAPQDSGTPLSGDTDPIHAYEDPADFSHSAPLMPGRAESADSSADAGLEEPDDIEAQGIADEESYALESADLDEDLDGPQMEEIPMANLDIESADDAGERNRLESPILDAPDTPGQIDIEALGDNAIEELLPPDARLDPIEE